ncbi:MAG: hypothetical protein ABIT08_16360 [Bacteroidia bacterium]
MKEVLKNRVLFFSSLMLSWAVVYFRRPDAFTNPQFWGEEGKYFFADAYHSGFSSLFNKCNGYFQLFPRLIACLVKSLQIPPEYIPALYNYTWLLVFTGLLVYVWQRLKAGTVKKFFISLSLIIIPLQSEIIMNLTNVQWIFAPFLVIIFSSPQKIKTNKWFWADLLIVFFTGLTGPGCTVLIPLFIFLLYKQKNIIFQNRKQIILFTVAIGTGIVQVISLFNYGSVDRTEGAFTLLNTGFLKFFFYQYAFLLAGEFILNVPAITMIICSIVFLLLIVYLFLKIYKQRNVFGFIALTTGLLFWLASAISYRHDPGFLDPYYNGVRNFYLPSVTFIWTLIYISSMQKQAIILFACLMILFFIETILFVGRTRFSDLHWKTYSAQIHAAKNLKIPINPPGWYIEIENAKKNDLH